MKQLSKASLFRKLKRKACPDADPRLAHSTHLVLLQNAWVILVALLVRRLKDRSLSMTVALRAKTLAGQLEGQ